MELSMSDLKSKARKYELALGAGGFFLGVTAKDAKAKANLGLVERTTDFLGRVGVGGVALTDPGTGTVYTSVANLKFNPFGFINLGLGAYIALALAEAFVDGPEVNLVTAFGKPIALGYSIGGMLDPEGFPASYANGGNRQPNASQASVGSAMAGWR